MITEAQLVSMALTFVPMIIAVLIGILMNNACLGDVRDLLRAEIKGTRDMMDAKFDAVEAKMERNHSEMSRRFAELDTRIGRIESSLGMQR